MLPFKSYFTRSPFIGVFRLDKKYEFVFVNVHLKARRLDEDENERTKDEALSLSILAEAMDDTVGKDNDHPRDDRTLLSIRAKTHHHLR